MKYGYVRSNLQEAIEKQIQKLNEFELEKIVEDTDGLKLLELLHELKPGDSLYVVSPDRFSRHLKEFSLILMVLELKQVTLTFVNNSNLKTSKDAMFAYAINKLIAPLADCDEDD